MYTLVEFIMGIVAAGGLGAAIATYYMNHDKYYTNKFYRRGYKDGLYQNVILMTKDHSEEAN